MPYINEYKVKLIKVTQWKDGCVFKTKEIGEIWIPQEIELYTKESDDFAKQHGGDYLISMLPTPEIYDQWFRLRKVD